MVGMVLLGQGTSGCVFPDPLACACPHPHPHMPTHVSKVVFTKGQAALETFMASLIVDIDPGSEFTCVPNPARWCVVHVPHGACDATASSAQVGYQMVMPNGGPTLEDCDWEVSVRSMWDLLDGLTRLWVHGIVHGDISVQNVLSESPTGKCRLIDFGFARVRQTDIGSLVPDVAGFLDTVMDAIRHDPGQSMVHAKLYCIRTVMKPAQIPAFLQARHDILHLVLNDSVKEEDMVVFMNGMSCTMKMPFEVQMSPRTELVDCVVMMFPHDGGDGPDSVEEKACRAWDAFCMATCPSFASATLEALACIHGTLHTCAPWARHLILVPVLVASAMSRSTMDTWSADPGVDSVVESLSPFVEYVRHHPGNARTFLEAVTSAEPFPRPLSLVMHAIRAHCEHYGGMKRRRRQLTRSRSYSRSRSYAPRGRQSRLKRSSSRKMKGRARVRF